MKLSLVQTLLTPVVVTCLVGLVQTKIGFVKDQSMDAVFPGPVYSQAPSLPVGHMRPLGWQRQPDGPIQEENEMPATREFYKDYVSTETPAVFRSAVNEAPAFVTWQDDKYLNERYGHLNVSVRVKIARKKDKIESEAQVMKFKKFLYEYMYEEWYLASVIPRDLMEELPLPKCVRCGTISDNLISAQLWMSSGGTSSRVHSHEDHLLHCVLFGRRDFILIEGTHKKAFDFIEDYSGSIGGHSDINTEMINAFKYKQIARVPWIWATLYPGDCVFVPAGYLHQVRSHGRSISITVEFATLSRFDDTGCTLIEEDFVPLSDAFYLLEFEDGKLRLSDTELDAEDLRTIFLTLMGKKGVLSRGKFQHFYEDVLGEGDDVPDPSRVFDFMTSEEQESQITRKDLQNMRKEVLQKVVDVFNSVISRNQQKENTEKDDDNKQQPVHEEF